MNSEWSPVEEEIHQRGDDEQRQHETEDGPTATRLGSDWGVVHCVANAAEARVCGFRVTQFRILYCDVRGLNGVRAWVYSEARLSVHEYLNVP